MLQKTSSREKRVSSSDHWETDRQRKRGSDQGTAYDWEDVLYAGRFVRQNEIVGRIADGKDLTILAFAPEDIVGHLAMTLYIPCSPTFDRDSALPRGSRYSYDPENIETQITHDNQ